MSNVDSFQAKYEKAVEVVKQGEQVVNLIEKESREALIVTGLWEDNLKGREFETLISCFFSTVRMCNQRANALEVAVDYIDSIKDGAMDGFGGVFIEDVITSVNHALMCTSFEDYTPMDITIN